MQYRRVAYREVAWVVTSAGQEVESARAGVMNKVRRRSVVRLDRRGSAGAPRVEVYRPCAALRKKLSVVDHHFDQLSYLVPSKVT